MNTVTEPATARPRIIGRYAIFDEVGRGGAATVHIGRLMGPIGFSRTVAIKKMHESVAGDAEIAAMFLDEARLTGRIRHPNVVPVVDVLSIEGEVFLIMEYLHGETLASLLRAMRARHEPVPAPIAVQVVRDVLHGLHAAHEARTDSGEPLDMVHRDVSPHNIMVGADGISRVLDFGIAKAVGRIQDTHTGQLKGKVAYMAPEQILGRPIDRRVDIYAAGLVLWETLAGRRLFHGDSSGEIMYRVLREKIPRLSLVPAPIADVVARAIEREPADRFATAFEFARALEEASEPVAPTAIGDWVRQVSGPALNQRLERLQEIETTPIGVVRNAVDARPRGPRASRVVAIALAGCVVVAATSALALRPHHKEEAATEHHEEAPAAPPVAAIAPPVVAPESESTATLSAADSSTGEGTRVRASSPSSDRGAASVQANPQDSARANTPKKSPPPKGAATRPPLRRAEDLFSRE
jgi:serine/threonine-protein kinase